VSAWPPLSLLSGPSFVSPSLPVSATTSQPAHSFVSLASSFTPSVPAADRSPIRAWAGAHRGAVHPTACCGLSHRQPVALQWCPIGMAWPPAWLARSTVGHGFGRAFAIPDRTGPRGAGLPRRLYRSIGPMGWACGATAWPSARARTASLSTGTAAALVTCACAGLQDKKNGLAGSTWSTEEARCRPQPTASSRPTSVPWRRTCSACNAAFMNHAACSARPALNLRRDASQPRASPRRVCHDAVRGIAGCYNDFEKRGAEPKKGA
jgi:hypothetical protein